VWREKSGKVGHSNGVARSDEAGAVGSHCKGVGARASNARRVFGGFIGKVHRQTYPDRRGFILHNQRLCGTTLFLGVDFEQLIASRSEKLKGKPRRVEPNARSVATLDASASCAG
jgi:hypothetical protein